LGKLPVTIKKFDFLVVTSEAKYAMQMTTVLGCNHRGCIDIYELWMFMGLKLIAQLQHMELIHILPINIFLTFASEDLETECVILMQSSSRTSVPPQ
jgi:hypothetical protein